MRETGWTVQQLTQVLLRALDQPSITCGSLTLNFLDGELSTYDVKEHFRAPKDLAPTRVQVDEWKGTMPFPR